MIRSGTQADVCEVESTVLTNCMWGEDKKEKTD